MEQANKCVTFECLKNSINLKHFRKQQVFHISKARKGKKEVK